MWRIEEVEGRRSKVEGQKSKIEDLRSSPGLSLRACGEAISTFVIARRNDEAISGGWGSSPSHFQSSLNTLLSHYNEIAALHCVALAMTEKMFVIARSDRDEATSRWWGSSQFYFRSKTNSLSTHHNEIAALHFVTLAMTSLKNLQLATSNLQPPSIFNLQSSIFNRFTR